MNTGRDKVLGTLQCKDPETHSPDRSCTVELTCSMCLRVKNIQHRMQVLCKLRRDTRKWRYDGRGAYRSNSAEHTACERPKRYQVHACFMDNG